MVDLKFELQIRTVLQHAWAELAHDRTYKFNSGLPSDISRKINLYAGLLEIADLGFNEIINDINDYSDKISKETTENLSKEEVNSITLAKFFLDFCSRHNFNYSKSNLNKFKSNSMTLVNELRSFGISNIDELNNIFTEDFIDCFNSIFIEGGGANEIYIYGLIRCVLTYSDIDKYFRVCSPDWSSMNKKLLHMLYKKYGEEKVASIIHKNGMVIGK